MQFNVEDSVVKGRKSENPERLSWGVIEFQVTDLDRTIAFWTRALGLALRFQDEQRAELGTQEKTLFVFHSGATQTVKPHHTGMYHVAIGMPDQAEFSRLLARLITLRIPVAPTDHLLSKSLYIVDPDGLEIELTFETPERLGRFGDLSRGLNLIDAAGNDHSGRAPLDVEAELAFAQGANIEAPLSNTAYLAHMHFKVPDIETSTQWYEGIGFTRGLSVESWGFADMSANETYTHRLAMNIWAGVNRPPAPKDMARLTQYTLHVHEPSIFENEHGLTPSDVGLTGVDPTGTDILLMPAFSS